MTSEHKHLFASYAQQDAGTVSRFVEQLRYSLRLYGTPVASFAAAQAASPRVATHEKVACYGRGCDLLII